MTWITTYTGRRFDYASGDPDIHIDDIAHALSLICRFNGHVREHYSVATHSIVVYALTHYLYEYPSKFSNALGANPTAADYALREQMLLAALLHDAPEAYYCDIPTPLKDTPRMEGYRSIEKKLTARVYKKYGLTFKEVPDVVRYADHYVLKLEYEMFFDADTSWTREGRDPAIDFEFTRLLERLRALPPSEIEKRFKDTFYELRAQLCAKYMEQNGARRKLTK